MHHNLTKNQNQVSPETHCQLDKHGNTLFITDQSPLTSTASTPAPAPADPPHYALCRRCGRDAFDPAALLTHSLSQSSPFDLHAHAKNLSLVFGRADAEGIPVQRLKNPQGGEFDVVLVRRASCQGYLKVTFALLGASNRLKPFFFLLQWTSEATWFPGFAWKSCVCSQCGTQLGWMFMPEDEAVETVTKATDEGFYALILDKLIDEACTVNDYSFSPP